MAEGPGSVIVNAALPFAANGSVDPGSLAMGKATKLAPLLLSVLAVRSAEVATGDNVAVDDEKWAAPADTVRAAGGMGVGPRAVSQPGGARRSGGEVEGGG